VEGSPPSASDEGFDWKAAENQLLNAVPPMFVEGGRGPDGETLGDAFDVEVSKVRLADVGGMRQVKDRLEAALFAPMRNPELSKLFGKKLHGGLLLYGPPGCGKTFIARAVAGELGAHFLSVTLADVLDMWIGASERNLHEVFQTARRHAPCVLFLDEVDAIGQKRSQLRNSALRGSVNQLLLELDDIGVSNDSVFVLAATNHPWDVDAALRRPGRFDRTVLVLPPDTPARETILRLHLRDRPVAGIDVATLADVTGGYSGADLAHICEVAAERALLDSAATGTIRMIEQSDLTTALLEVRPSTGAWFETVRNVVRFANQDGTYDELSHYLQERHML
jgi:SpoVK/Ycf46/Vps4 family AAA+-type ATPase